MRRIAWEERQPGHLEVDLVHHCGLSSQGQYVHTLQLVDVASGWSECVAVLGRSGWSCKTALSAFASVYPSQSANWHPDNGSEFFNDPMLRFWQDRILALVISRSRPYHKNDNRFVEENTPSLVRAYVGHGRLDRLDQLLILRQLYAALWLYQNFFQPGHAHPTKIVVHPQQPPRRVC